MKNIFNAGVLVIGLLWGSMVKAQVAIGKTEPITITNASVLLEFGSEPKGIIVPQVSSVSSPAGGTFVFNNSSGVLSMQVYENGMWKDLTSDSTTIPKTIGISHNYTNSGTVDTIGLNGVIIGANTSTKNGVLVLESTDKALLLPLVANPHQSIKGAIAGTMVYDTTSDTLAVYDGIYWSYWK